MLQQDLCRYRIAARIEPLSMDNTYFGVIDIGILPDRV